LPLIILICLELYRRYQPPIWASRLKASHEYHQALTAREERVKLREDQADQFHLPESTPRILVEYSPVPDEPDAKDATVAPPTGPSAPHVDYAQQAEVAKPASWTIKSFVSGFLSGCLGNIAILVFLYWRNNPDLSLTQVFVAAIEYAFVSGWFVVVMFLGLLSIAVMKVYAMTVEELKAAKKREEEIIAQAQEVLANAQEEAREVVDSARREAGEIIKTANQEAAEIRVEAKDEAKEVRDQAKQEADQMAEAIRKEAEADAKGKVDQAREKMNKFWLLVEAKATKVGVPTAELPELLKAMQKAEKEAGEIIAQAESQAKEAAEDIIAEARAQAHEEAEQIIAQAETQTQKNSQELLHIAREEAAEIVDQAWTQAAEIKQGQVQGTQKAGEIAVQPIVEQGQVNDELPVQGILSEAETSPNGERDDQGQEADQVAALEAKIQGLLFGQPAMKKRELEQKANKTRYDVSFWESTMSKLLTEGKIVYDPGSKTYRCNHPLFNRM
jgi:vacuolar-type H+-ATPase subunit H